MTTLLSRLAITQRPQQPAPIEDMQRDWIERLPVVARMVDQGSWPWSYGSAKIGEAVWPTKFYLPSGGMEHPHHVRQGEGAKFLVWSFKSDISLEESQHLPVWSLSGASWLQDPEFPTQHALTLSNAAEQCCVYADRHIDRFIVPVWDQERLPWLRIREWSELGDYRDPDAAVRTEQLGLFDDPMESPVERLQRTLRKVAVLESDDPETWCSLHGDLALIFAVEQLVTEANRARVTGTAVPA